MKPTRSFGSVRLRRALLTLAWLRLGSGLVAGDLRPVPGAPDPAPPTGTAWLAVVFDAARAPEGDLLLMDGGDCIAGQWLVDPLPVRVATNTVQVALKDARAMVLLRSSPPQVRITLRNGDTLNGACAAEHLALRVRSGQILRPRGPEAVPATAAGDAPARDAVERVKPAAPGTPGEPGSDAVAPMPAATEPPPGLAPTNMVWIRPGEFLMGSPPDESGRDQDEGPQTQVSLPSGFYIGKCEVTQGEYQRIMGANPSHFLGDPQRPVEKVRWTEAMEYCARLSEASRAAASIPAGWDYRLPTEAEWEYACRAGNATRFSYGADREYAQLGRFAWFQDNSDSATHPVGTRQPNAWGLHDMHGNVWEWCLDRWEDALPGGRITNRVASAQGALRVARGGSWLYDGRICRSANRDDYSPANRCSDVGFRIVLAPAAP